MTEATVTAITPMMTTKRLVKSAVAHPLFEYRLLIVTAGVLLTLGLLMVISSSSVIAAADEGDPYYYGKRQLILASAGLLGAWAMSRLSEKWLRRLVLPALGLAIVFLMLTILTPLGVCVGGNCNWLRLGPAWTQFQPSEFAKLAIILWGADALARRQKLLTDLRQWFVYLAMTFTMIGLVVFEHDQGTAMVMTLLVLAILLVAGAPWRLLISLGVLAGAAVTALIIFQPNRLDRLWAFLDPTLDPYGINLQQRRGLYALASGGWFGKGLGSSHQKWGLLSEAHTDFIFAIIGEELGLAGSLMVIGLFTVLGIVGIRVALNAASTFSRLVAIGVVAWFSVQALVNIAVATRSIPVMGITLPLISYGGSSLLATLAAMGLLVGCARRVPATAAALAERRTKPRATTIVGAGA